MEKHLWIHPYYKHHLISHISSRTRGYIPEEPHLWKIAKSTVEKTAKEIKVE